MPFNMAVASGGRRFFLLQITSTDEAINYNVESQIISQYGVSGTLSGDAIKIEVSASINLIAANTAVYAIDANDVDPDARLEINIGAGALISGRGGNGGNGGTGFWDTEPPAQNRSTGGTAGSSAGTAIRYGCPTELTGAGTIRKGYGGGGGGGGGASGSIESEAGGGGGGGGAPLGIGGNGGITVNRSGGDGVSGGTATVTADGGGGAAGDAAGGAGGAGGDSAGAAASGSAGGGSSGGTAGSDGDAIHTQTFSHTNSGSATITGTVV